MPARARRLIRKMRGGAQSHLIQADDGQFYVVKFVNNPQGRRVLVNEWLGGVMLQYLGVACPRPAIIEVDSEFLGAAPEVCIQLGTQRVQPLPGWHFGSQHPGDPARVAVYDFVPDTLLERVENLNEFAGVLVFDKWTGNADARQSVFLRARVREFAPSSRAHPLRMGFVALMIDHGYLFNGPHWDYVDSPLTGMYFRPQVYRRIRGWQDYQPWLDRVLHFPDEVIDDALRQLPPEWLDGDAEALQRLLERLLDRRRRVPDLLRDCAKAVPAAFAEWAER